MATDARLRQLDRILRPHRSETGSVVYFAVDDIESAVAELQDRGVSFDDEPHMIFLDDEGRFGPAGIEEWMVFFKDSEGNLLALSERRSPSWSLWLVPAQLPAHLPSPCRYL